MGNQPEDLVFARRQLGDQAGALPSLDRVLGRSMTRPAPVGQERGGLVPLGPFQDPGHRAEPVQRGVAVLPARHHDHVFGVGEAGDGLFLQAGVLRGQHVDLAAPIDEPRRDGDVLALILHPDPDHVRLPESILDLARQLLGSRLQHDLELRLPEHLAVQ